MSDITALVRGVAENCAANVGDDVEVCGATGVVAGEDGLELCHALGVGGLETTEPVLINVIFEHTRVDALNRG